MFSQLVANTTHLVDCSTFLLNILLNKKQSEFGVDLFSEVRAEDLGHSITLLCMKVN